MTTYRIARNGQIYGPYTSAEVERYLASGHILPGDLAQLDVQPDAQSGPQPGGHAVPMREWLPVAVFFPAAPTAAAPHPGGLPVLFPDPPDLPWWIALIVAIATGGLFFVIWDIVESAWMRRIDRASVALYLYIAAAVLYAVRLPYTWHVIDYNLFGGPQFYEPYSGLLSLLGLVLFLASRFVFRNELLRHFNRGEPIGLRLNWLLTLLFGGLYFQYHFNRINEVKCLLRISVPST